MLNLIHCMLVNLIFFQLLYPFAALYSYLMNYDTFHVFIVLCLSLVLAAILGKRGHLDVY